MKTTALDIDVRLKLSCNQHLSAELLISAIQCVNDAYFASELSDLRAIRKEFPKLPQVAFDAAEHRMKKYKKTSVLINAVDKGSIEIAIAATGLAIWVLQQTLGETLKEAWQESDWHKQLKQFLLKGRHKKVEKVREDAQKRLERKLPVDRVNTGDQQSLDNVSGDGAIIKIEVFIRPDKRHAPRRGELFDSKRMMGD